MQRVDRRQFVWGAASLLLVESRAIAARGAAAPEAFEPWRKGLLDIHHISTGRGNSVLAICPDGTSIMVDAGAIAGTTQGIGPARPNDSRRPGEWIGRYALRQLQTAPKQELDYFVLTHFHNDHMGEPLPGSPLASSGGYRLAGVTDVAELLPIRRLIDRGSPDYNYPAVTTYAGTLNYIQFAKALAARGGVVERAKVGSREQIALRHGAAEFPSVGVRVLAANGEVWTGKGNETRQMFPPISTLKPEQYPPENPCSIALRLEYGAFRYYIGGDLTCDTEFGTKPWQDVETAVAKAAGPVNVCALDHHGYYDATGPEFVRAMHPRIYVIQTWHATHPALSVLNELYSTALATGPRDVFATGLVEAASITDQRLSDKMLSQQGHVVVRVHPGGGTYEVIVLDDSNEDGNVKGKWGPYTS